MRANIPLVFLLLNLLGVSCSTQSQRELRPRVPSPQETDAGSDRPSPSATPIVEDQPVSTGTSDLPSTTTSLAQAPAPQTETSASETAPTIDRTSVVVGNGRFAPTRSFWLKFPSDNEALKALVAYTSSHSKASKESFHNWTVQGFQTFCAENVDGGANASLSFLFFRYSEILQAEGVRAADSTDGCSLDKQPRFKERDATLSESPSLPKAPAFLCTYDRSDKEWLLGFDLMAKGEDYALRIHTMNANPWDLASADLKTSRLLIDERGQPSLIFSGEWGELQFFPYQARSEAFLGRTVRADEANQDLNCRIGL